MEQSCTFDVDVTEADVDAFARLSGDRNALHTSADYARTTEYGRPIVHGALLVGLVSRVLGMHIPGERSVMLSLAVRFPKPLFHPARVRVDATLTYFNAERGTGAVHVAIADVARSWVVLESDVLFGLHASGAEAVAAPRVASAPTVGPAAVAGTKPRLLVTGGTGGIGRPVVAELSSVYDIRLLRRHEVDLEVPGVLEQFLDATSPRDFYGVLHMSVPAISTAFASDDVAGVRRHLRHGLEVPLLLAAWARRAESSVRRLVLVGSTAGLQHPRPEVGAYSIGKAAMEHLTRLLTSDLAAQSATVNIVVPSLVPVGVNDGLSDRARATLAGRTPTGRLVAPGDIAAVIGFLLSDAAAQINGATMVVDGGAKA